MNFEPYKRANDKIVVPPELIEKTVARMQEAQDERERISRRWYYALGAAIAVLLRKCKVRLILLFNREYGKNRKRR